MLQHALQPSDGHVDTLDSNVEGIDKANPFKSPVAWQGWVAIVVAVYPEFQHNKSLKRKPRLPGLPYSYPSASPHAPYATYYQLIDQSPQWYNRLSKRKSKFLSIKQASRQRTFSRTRRTGHRLRGRARGDYRRPVSRRIGTASELSSVAGRDGGIRTAHERSSPKTGRNHRECCMRHRDGRYTLVICAENLPDDVKRMARWLDGKLQDLGTDGTRVGAGGRSVFGQGMGTCGCIIGDCGHQQDRRARRPPRSAIRRSCQSIRASVGVGVTTVDASLAGTSAIALSTDGFAVPPGPSPPISKIPRKMVGGREGANACRIHNAGQRCAGRHRRMERWHARSSAGTSRWRPVVAGLRLFADRLFFVSEKDLLSLGLEEVGLVA